MTLALLLCAAFHGAWTSFALAAEPAEYQADSADLYSEAYAVIVANIEKQDVGLSETIAGLRVTRSFKGPLSTGQRVRLQVQSGRVRVTAGQPDLTGVRQAVFFLAAPKKDGGPFECLNDNYGFKPIVNGHVYTNPQDPIFTVKLKKYLDTLKASTSQAETFKNPA